ncbi:MAG: glutamate--tRNA ligase [Acidobacteria bacterium RIFCSPLOWO2_12_FULL_67_14b]|nr:MAG: glutamate--tRNA ligase [Acidobacteria bacterium RIFCSPLOWO2_12_FULL_67_14b]
MRVRFAPSPTGHLHVGNARTALFNWLLARGQNGTYILRIEDTDAERSTRQSEQAILDDLRWMGLQWDEGVEAGGDHGPYRQTERFPIYADHTHRLLQNGKGYYCFCSAETLEAQRKAQLAASLPPKYAGTCRNIPAAEAARRRSAGEPAVVRLRVPENREVTFHDVVRGPVTFHTDVIGDPVLVRSDGFPAYNFAVVIDDALMAITHVIRGEDHISNTPRQILLYEAFGWTPPAFAHLSLVMGPDHAPLSKRHGATSVREFRDKGYLPEALVNYLALIGWSPGQNDELLPAAELARRFRLENVAHSAGVFDEDKLAWANRHYLRLCAPDRLAALAQPFLRERGQIVGDLSAGAGAWLEAVLPGLAASIDRLPQLADRLEAVFRRPAAPLEKEPGLPEVAVALADELGSGSRLVNKDLFRAVAARVKDRTGLKGKNLFHPIRVILTGANEGPELDLIVPAIERAAELPRDCGLAEVFGCRERAQWVARTLAA